ncbi:MAG: ATP-binding protein [Actinomycetota bacterium]|nr:ATP-binding protein [Actinomycetota bacterium]
MTTSMTMRPARLPVRARVTAAFAAVMTGLLVGIGVLIYQSMASALLDEIDAGLRFRAESTLSTAHTGSVEVPNQARLQEPGEAFAQLLSRTGRIMSASEGFTAPLLARDELARMSRATFVQRPVRNVVGTARLLALPVGASRTSAVLVVGTTMADRSDALRKLRQVMLIGGPAAIAVACLAAWIVAGLALHPMERLRQQAAAITASGLDRRLTVPPARDELRRLAETLNVMLQRLDESFRHEREFLERASHELRTPLTALRAEVELSLGRPRSADELTTALQSVSQETDRLVRLAEDLLVLARTRNGRMPLHRQHIPLRDTVQSAAALFTAQALKLDITIATEAPDATIDADPLRLRQALVNLLDNALRHTPRGGTIAVTASVTSTAARIAVSDTGPGFADTAANPGDYDSESPHHQHPEGLGLRIVHAIAVSHHGTMRIDRNHQDGASVELTLPYDAAP